MARLILRKPVPEQARGAAAAPRGTDGCYRFAERPPDAGHGFPVLVFDADGMIAVPQKPGLGVELDEAKLQKYRN